MADQLTIEQAIEAGHQGATATSEAAGLDWLDYATEFVRTYLERNDTMHVDELWDAGLIEPVSPRALGAVISQAARNGWSVPLLGTSHGVTGQLYLPSKASNGQGKRVWRSLLR